MKRLIVYYSLSGNTQEAAETLAKEIGADLFRVETVKPMPKGMFGAMMYGGMQATFGRAPELKAMPQTDGYDEIILGTPVWANKPAAALNALMKDAALCEKVTAVFTCSGGGDDDKCIMFMERSLPNMKYTVSLTDKKQKGAEENGEKLKEFAQSILNR